TDNPMMGGGDSNNDDSDDTDNPMMGGGDSNNDDSDDTDNPMIVGENPFGDINTDNLFADLDNLSESLSENLETGKAQYESFSKLFNNFEASEASADTEGDELAPFTNFLNTLSKLDIELPEGSSITNLSEFPDLASSFQDLSLSNAEAFIGEFSGIDFTPGSNPFSEANPSNPFTGEDNPFTQITEIFAVDSDSAV
uniref:hypothetical protein n=1 Tax=Calothrix sp. CCY 0018 TaxID=3103864 RepID=UPI0039C679BB